MDAIVQQLVAEPLDAYELVDFGAGRKLERLGPLLVDRPDPRASGPCSRSRWEPDWSYVTFAATGRWVPRRDGLPREWDLHVHGRSLHARLEADGGVGFDPEQIPCWLWVRQRLAAGRAHGAPRILDLFAGNGGASAVAEALGAEPVCVAADPESARRVRVHLAEGVERIHEDVQGFIDRAPRAGETFDLILVRPCDRARGPGGRSWDISCDLNPLLAQLSRLASRDCQGVWLSPREAERGKQWRAHTLAGLLHDSFPGRAPVAVEPGIATRDGRVLPVGAAACWIDDTAPWRGNAEATALDAVALEERLDVYLDAVLSSRRTASAPARAVASLARDQQEFVLGWLEAICRTNAELAYQFAAVAPRALQCMDRAQVEQWLLGAMDVFDAAGLHAAVTALQGAERFAEQVGANQSAVALEEVCGTLELFVRGLTGRPLRVGQAERPWTDTETLFLPQRVDRFAERGANLELYRAMAIQLWAQLRFGTLRKDLAQSLRRFPDPERALRQFLALERLRLDACIARELPGRARRARQLRAELGEPMVPAGWETLAETLRHPQAQVGDTLGLLSSVYDEALAAPVCDQVDMDLARVEQRRSARIAREREEFQAMLARMIEEAAGGAPRPEAAPRVALRQAGGETAQAGVELVIEGRPVPPPAEARGLISSILLDFGEIPPEYLVAAGSGAYMPDPGEPPEHSDDVWRGTYHEEGALRYNEWDCKRRHYRKNWCVLRERDVHPRPGSFAQDILRKYAGLVKIIRRTFEVLRGEEKVLKKEPHGDDVDVEALVEAYTDTRCGMEMTDRLYTRKRKLERNIALMLMVDMSGSTKGWINEAEREALVLLCEALEILGDRYAIYGFSGTTRKRCEVFRVKRFDEPYGDVVKQRIGAIAPQDYTRMGVTIRHLTRLLNDVEARTRVLITLSDGKPDDFDGYRGEYGIEDTRMALIEAKRDGIHPFCITIDEQGRDYLPHMYGAASYTLVDDVRKLPVKVSEIYRKLTT